MGAPPVAAAVAAAAGAAEAWLAAAPVLSTAVNRALIVCVTRSDCAAIPFGAKGMLSNRHKVLRAAIGSCRTAGAE